MSDFVLFSENDGLGTISFNNPQSSNALNLADIQSIDRQLRLWQADNNITGVRLRGDGLTAFSAGEDFNEVFQAIVRNDVAYLTDMMLATHRLIHLWANYSKPTMAVMNGVARGIGAGLGMAAKIRVVTELTLFSVPQCRLGLIPDAGSAFYLSKCPGKIGLFLALTGMDLRAPGLMYAGLGTHYLQLQDVDWVNFQNVDELKASSRSGPLAMIQPEIDRCFDQRSIGEIITVLMARKIQGFQDILRQIQESSPLALALAFRHFTAAAGQDLSETLRDSYRINRRLLLQTVPKEGLRAYFIDRDGKPSWPSDSVTAGEIDSYFLKGDAAAELDFSQN